MTSSSKDPFALFDAPVRNFLLRHGILGQKGESAWPVWGVAVSGGGDSVLLLHLLARHRPPGTQLEVLHFNHHTDPDKNSRHHSFVVDLARGLDLPTISGESPSPERSRPDVSETALRGERQKFFREYLENNPGALLFLGHQRDDRIETVLANLFRGTGPRGLIGIRERTGRLYRPLLSFGRIEIRRALEEAGQLFMDDPTNLDLAHLRNRIRLELRPAIDRLFPPDGTSHLDLLAQLMEREISERSPLPIPLLLLDEAPGSLCFSLRLYRALSPSRQGEFLSELLRRQSTWKMPLPPERNLLRTLREPPATPLKNFPLGEGWRLDIVSDHVDLVYHYPDTQNNLSLLPLPSPEEEEIPITLPRGGRLWIRRLKEAPADFPCPRPSVEAVVPEESFSAGGAPLHIGYRLPGQSIWQPEVRSKEVPDPPRTLSSLWKEKPLPSARKDRLPVLSLGDAAIWIPGWLDRTGDLYRSSKGPFISITFQLREPSWWKKFLENP